MEAEIFRFRDRESEIMAQIPNQPPQLEESALTDSQVMSMLSGVAAKAPVQSGPASVDPQMSLMLDSMEKQLQSLGFVVSNGEARFKLGEAAMNAGGNTDFSIIDGEEDPASFVILGKCSMESIQTSSMASYMDIHQKSVSVDYNSMISSLDSHDIHQKLTELLQENGRLKEALKQNNTAMKQQISTLASWQEEMMKVHQSHKKKFTETTDLIKYLKKENCELKMKLSMDQFENPETAFNIIGVNACEERQEPESTIIEEMPQNLLPLELVTLTNLSVPPVLTERKDEIQEVASKGTSLSESSQAPEESAMDEKRSLNDEKLRFIKERETLAEEKRLFAEQKKMLESAQNNLNHACEERQESKSTIIEEIPQNLSSLELVTLTNLSVPPVLPERKDEIQEIASKGTSLSESSQAPEESVMDEKRSLDDEKLRFIKEREALEEEKKLFAEQKKIFESAQKDLNDARELLERKKIILDEEKTSLDHQSRLYESFEKTLLAEKKSLETQCVDLMSELDTMKTIFTQKDSEIKELQLTVQQQKEVIYSLEVQMKMNEEDFMQERKIKDCLLIEHNKVAADLTFQMEFCKELRQKLVASKTTALIFGHSSVPPLPELRSVSCPKCGSAFRDSDTLVKHVDDCLELQ